MKKQLRIWLVLWAELLVMVYLLWYSNPFEMLSSSSQASLIDTLLASIYILVYVILSVNDVTLLENGYEKKYSFTNFVLFLTLLFGGGKMAIVVAFISTFIVFALQFIKERKLKFLHLSSTLIANVTSATVMGIIYSAITNMKFPEVNFPTNFFAIIVVSLINYLIQTLFSIQNIYLTKDRQTKSFRNLLFQEYGWMFRYDFWQAVYSVMFYNTVGVFLYNNLSKTPSNSANLVIQYEFIYFLFFLFSICIVMYVPIYGWLQSFKTFVFFNKQNVSNVIVNMQEGIIVLDTEGLITTHNKAASKIFELYHPMQTGESFEIVLKNIGQKQHSSISVLESIQNALYTRKESLKTSLILYEGKSKRHLEIIVTPETNRFQEVTGSVITIEDTTQLNELLEEKNVQLQIIKNISSELEKKLKELEDTQEQLVISEKMAVIGQLVAGVAHEINTPLASIKSNNDLEKMLMSRLDPENPELVKKFSNSLTNMNNINSMALDRIMGIVKSLKNFARLDEADLKEVDLHEGLDSTLAIVQSQLSNKKIEILKDYSNIPLVACFPQQLNQVFLNIIVNASQAIPDSGGTITITTYHRDKFVFVSIQDSGEGIKPENIAKIFDPGFTTKGSGVGTGLGLSICFRIISKHNGKIHVNSELGIGTEFIIELPLSVLAEGGSHE